MTRNNNIGPFQLLILLLIATITLHICIAAEVAEKPTQEQAKQLIPEQLRRIPYDVMRVPTNAPRCIIHVRENLSVRDLPNAVMAVKQFALTNGFQEFAVPKYQFYSGPGYLESLFQNDQFMIWEWSNDPYPTFRITACKTNYDAQTFTRLTNALVTMLNASFTNRVIVNPTN